MFIPHSSLSTKNHFRRLSKISLWRRIISTVGLPQGVVPMAVDGDGHHYYQIISAGISQIWVSRSLLTVFFAPFPSDAAGNLNCFAGTENPIIPQRVRLAG